MSLRRLHLDTSWGMLAVVGGSRAGEGTLVILPQLRLALDAGRPHRALPPMSTVCISHGHSDHLSSLGYWASQRMLNSMGPATAVVPEVIADDVASLLDLYARLEGGGPYRVSIVPVTDGSRHRLRPDMDLHFFRADHWVPTLGVELRWRRRRLRAELAGLSRQEIADRRLGGEEVSETSWVSLVACCADTGPVLFDRLPDLLAAEVVLLECSFFRSEDRERASRFGHMHIEQLESLAPHLGCRHLVLLHASRRHRLREVEAVINDRLRPLVPCALHHLNVDWD